MWLSSLSFLCNSIRNILESSDTKYIIFDNKYLEEIIEISGYFENNIKYIINDIDKNHKEYPVKLDNLYLDNSDDLNIGGSYGGALKFIGGGSYAEQMRI